MIVINGWREQIKVQVKAHLSRTDVERVPRRSTAVVATCFFSMCLGRFVTFSDVAVHVDQCTHFFWMTVLDYADLCYHLFLNY